MSFGDVIEWAVSRNWSARYVMLRGLALLVLATCFTGAFKVLFMAYVNWKSGTMLHDFQHFFPPTTPSASP